MAILYSGIAKSQTNLWSIENWLLKNMPLLLISFAISFSILVFKKGISLFWSLLIINSLNLREASLLRFKAFFEPCRSSQVLPYIGRSFPLSEEINSKFGLFEIFKVFINSIIMLLSIPNFIAIFS